MNSEPKLCQDWTIYLVHHTHVDIGYTEPQSVILRKHAEFVAQALDYCTATDSLPPGERFCWTCEVAWTVKAFLARYPERAEEFFRRVREGRVEVTALYLQLTDLFTLPLLEQTTDYAVDLARRHGFDVVTAMNDDVNGWAWGLPDLLARRGVRYMDTAINETRALGVRPRPSPFRWTGPRGGSVLFWHSDGYLHGNSLGLVRPDAGERVVSYLKGLEDHGYAHNTVEVRIHSRAHDNAPPGLWLCEVVRAWNAAHANPRLILCTPCDWFREVEAHWPGAITEHRAGWPDWFADGNGSAAGETALVRQAQADLVTLNALTTATGVIADAERVDRAREAAAFFCEHTWGAWCSTDAPAALTSRAQWNTKAGYAYTAAVEARSLVQDMLAAHARAMDDGLAGILVFNPLGETRSGLAEVLLPDADLGLATAAWVQSPVRMKAGPAFHLEDTETGARIAVCREPAIADSARRPAQVARFMAPNILARGFRRYRVVAGECPDVGGCGFREGRLESPTLAVTPDPDGVGILSIRDRFSGWEWVGAGADFALGEVVYETIPGPFGREKLCGWGAIKRGCPFVRMPIRFGPPSPMTLPYGAGMRIQAQSLPGSLRSLVFEVVVYDELPRVDLRYRLEKVPETEAEALYVAFPLANALGQTAPVGDSVLHLPRTAVWLDVPGAAMRPGVDQVPGAATDWHGIQHGFAVTGDSVCVALASPDISLVQVNGINTGKWQEALPSPNGLVMSWVFNNYWFTNFPAAQGGVLEWRYSLMAWPGEFDPVRLDRFTASVRQPLVATVQGGVRAGNH